jgi:hypothetical protein
MIVAYFMNFAGQDRFHVSLFVTEQFGRPYVHQTEQFGPVADDDDHPSHRLVPVHSDP